MEGPGCKAICGSYWYFSSHKGRVLGAIFGLIAGILLLKYGFWKTLLVADLYRFRLLHRSEA